MGRFPIFRIYYALLLIGAALLLISGLLNGLGTVNQFQSFGVRDFFGLLGVFLPLYLSFAGGALFLLVIAEGIKLLLNIEDHLYHIRNPSKPLSDLRRAHRTSEVQRKLAEAAAVTAGELRSKAKAGMTEAQKRAEELAKRARESQAAHESEIASARRSAFADDLDNLELNLDDEPLAPDLSDLDAPQARPLVRQGAPKTTQEFIIAGLEEDSLLAGQPVPAAQAGGDTAAAEAVYQKGLKLWQDKQYSAAVAPLNEAIRLNPKHTNAYGCRAACHRELGETEKAKQDQAMYRQLKGQA